MNPFQFPVACSVCGGVGYGTAQTSAAQWQPVNRKGFTSTIVHNDPRVCQEVLRRKREQLDAALKSAQSLNV